MKKIAMYGALACLAALPACKEIGPKIDFGNAVIEDTTYETTVETKQARMVMIEEFTGVSCPPCPNGHAAITAIENQHPDHVATVGIQVYNFFQAYPVVDKNTGDTITKHDNRTVDGTDVGVSMGGISTTPVAAIDRIPLNSKLLLSLGDWSNTVNNRVSVPTPANVSITSNYDDASRLAVIKVKVAYTEAITTKQLLTVSIVEDSIVDAQEVGLSTDTFYNHMHVLRDILTLSTGSAILNSVADIKAGRVYERTFRYTVDAAWKPEHCKIIAFVSKNSNGEKEVEQAAEKKLK